MIKIAIAFLAGMLLVTILVLQSPVYFNKKEVEKLAIQHSCGSYNPTSGLFEYTK